MSDREKFLNPDLSIIQAVLDAKKAYRENKPTRRDSRWENVTASVGFPQGYAYDEEDNADANDYLGFLIEVVYGERIYYSKQIAHKYQIEDAYDSIYGLILDNMVNDVDSCMENVGLTRANTDKEVINGD